MNNQCLICKRTLTVYADDCNTVIATQGETKCCCGDIDETGEVPVYFNATCADCCPNHEGFQIYEGKQAGGGFYIVNPSF